MFDFSVDRSGHTPLTRQVYEHIRRLILDGIVQAGYKLPSTREFASTFNLSRNIVLDAYEQLLAEGFIESRRGSGTFVAASARLETMNRDYPSPSKHDCLQMQMKHHPDMIDFRSGIPALDLFPSKKWLNTTRKVLLDSSPTIWGYGHPEGRMELRTTLSDYLYQTRGVRCQPEQVIITSGATQAISLVGKLLLNQKHDVWIEDPVTDEIKSIFKQAGASIIPVPVDEFGITTDNLDGTERNVPAFIFVTPSHQFPLGGTLPIQRRIQLIQFAREHASYIVEDDYDSEIRYATSPIRSLQSLDPERVIYIGTFSKILAPALRLGYMILPHHLIPNGRDLKWFNDLHCPTLGQLTLDLFMKEGHLEQHIRKVKKVYQKRRDTLITCLQEAFPEQMRIYGDSTGLHLVAAFDHIEFTEEMFHAFEQSHIRMYPVAKHSYSKDAHKNKIIIGYGHLTPEQIKEGIRRFSICIHQTLHTSCT